MATESDDDQPGSPTVGSRREARERAMSLLYEAENKSLTPVEVLGTLPVRPDPYVVDVLEGVDKNFDDIDSIIGSHAIDWPLERMPALDRALLRMAVFELSHRLDVPTGVVIAEAVELAGIYSTDGSSRFVNGVLSAISNTVR